MSAGQRSLLEYTAMDRMLTIGLMDEETWKSAYAKMQDAEFGAEALEPCSVFAEVNRDDFQVGSIAVTNAAQGKAASLGEAIDEGLFGMGISYLTAGLFVGGIAATVAGSVIAAKNWGTAAMQGAAKATPAVNAAVNNAPTKFTQAVQQYNTVCRSVYVNQIEQGIPLSSEVIDGLGRGARSYLRKGGVSDDACHIFAPQIREIDGEQYVLFSDGSTLNMKTGKPGQVDTAYAEKIQNAYQNPNPDLLADVAKAEKAVQEVARETLEQTKQRLLEEARLEIDNIMQDMNTITIKTVTNLYLKKVKLPDDTPLTDLTDEQLRELGTELKKYDTTDTFDVDAYVDSYKKMRNAAAMTAQANPGELLSTSMHSLMDALNGMDALNKNWADALQHFGLDSNLTPLTIDDADLDDVLNYIDTDLKQKGQYNRAEFVKLRRNYTEIRDAQKAQGSAQQLADEVDDIAGKGKEGMDDLTDKADDAMTSGAGSSFWKWFGVGMAIAGLAMSVYSAYSAISEMKAYYHMEMIPIPRKMVDLGYLADGSTCYIYYGCTNCNRASVGMANDTLGDYGDLNGDVMKQWLALYTTKDTRAGSPIRAGFTKKVGTTSIPIGKTALSFFGFEYAVNMTDTRFTYNDKKKGIYLYYQIDGNGLTGTVESSNAYVVTGVLSALGGAGICAVLTAMIGKRKKKTATAA